jgi:hypothetical protein
MATESFSNSWNTVGTVPIADLPDARLQLHWAAQVVASFGNAVLETQEDDSQSNLGWIDNLGALCSRASSDGLSVGLRLADLTLLFLGPNHTIQEEFGLSGKALSQGFEWLTTAYSKSSGSSPSKPFALREYDMPPHAVSQDTPFSLQNIALNQELHHWYSNASLAIHDISSQWKQASPIRCWPHHFDLATLVTLDSGKGSEDARSVGCGMSPGDGTYNEPYFYVTPWPYPKKAQLPPLPLGFWHTEGFIGAILTASDLIKSGTDNTQAERVQQFFQKSTQACFTALGVTPS